MKVSDLPPGNLLSVQPETTIAEVAGQMRTGDSDSAVVMSEGRLVGIITERTWCDDADGIEPRHARADLVMTADPPRSTPMRTSRWSRSDDEIGIVALAGGEQGGKKPVTWSHQNLVAIRIAGRPARRFCRLLSGQGRSAPGATVELGGLESRERQRRQQRLRLPRTR
jgi:hypothetical protein